MSHETVSSKSPLSSDSGSCVPASLISAPFLHLDAIPPTTKHSSQAPLAKALRLYDRFSSQSPSKVQPGTYIARQGECIGYGRLWTAYSGQLLIPPGSSHLEDLSTPSKTTISTNDTIGGIVQNGETPDSPASTISPGSQPPPYDSRPSWSDMVIKVARLDTFSHRSTSDLRKGEYNRDGALKAILNEANVYQGALRELQGRKIPRFYGLYRINGLCVMILQRLGRAVAEDGSFDRLPIKIM